MHRCLRIAAVVAALGVVAAPAQAQLSFGAHGAMVTSVADVSLGGTETFSLSNTVGIGGRVVVSPPALPVSLVGSTEYYFIDCPAGADCSLWTASAAVNLGLPLPIVRPYLTGGIQYRGDSDDTNSDTAYLAGLGVQFNFAVSFFVEGVMEFVEVPAGLPENFDVSPFVMKAGIVF